MERMNRVRQKEVSKGGNRSEYVLRDLLPVTVGLFAAFVLLELVAILLSEHAGEAGVGRILIRIRLVCAGLALIVATPRRAKIAISPLNPEEQTMKVQQIAFTVILTYLWVMMILLGSIVLETFMVYPNIFHDPPRSLETALEFMTVRAPNDFFPPLGFLSWVSGIGSLILGWHVKSARYWILGSLLMLVCEGLFSMAFFWPRNTIMFIEGTEIHSAGYLKQIAQEFQTLHWSRLAFNAAGSAAIFVGFLKFYRYKITSEDAH